MFIQKSGPSNGLMRVSQLALALAMSLGGAAAAQAQTAAPAGDTAAQPVKSKAAADKTAAQSSTKDKDGNDVVIVTGVLAKTKAKTANVSYSVLSQDDIDRFTPISASDMLRDMPGTVVETNDGVARNEVFTRGMVIGTGSNTSGYFWTTLLEDGLPVIAAKFSGFQDGDFYRADISTSKVESVRGGSSATGLTTAIGATFNFMDNGPIVPGSSIQTRLGFEGTDNHLSWKQVDGYYGWMNKYGDFGYKVSGFFRTSNGAINPGYDVNLGGQLKAMLYKSYSSDWGSGTFRVTVKHLDDRNAVLTNTYTPAYNYNDPVAAQGFPKYPDLQINGGVHQVPLFDAPGYQTDDPSQGFHYKQDAVWLNWEHHTNGHWSFAVAAKTQDSSTFGQQYQDNGVLSLTNSGIASDLGTSVDGLNKVAGYYEYFDSQTGELMAKVANQPSSGAKIGTDYRTGLACTTNCVVYNTLPNRDFNLNGGTVCATVPTSTGAYPCGTIPSSGSGTDLVDITKSEFSLKTSRDLMGNFTANWSGDHFNWNFGLYVDRSRQSWDAWGSGFGISPWADGQIRNLNVQFVTTTGKDYQLTDPGGWGQLGTGSTGTFFAHADIFEAAPYFGVAWSPDRHWDLNFTAKYDFTHSKSTYDNYSIRNPGAASLTNGGLDGNPLTVYDNLYFVDSAATVINADKSIGVWNYSGSIGYNFTDTLKTYYRYTSSAQTVNGAISRYTTASSLVKDLGPNALMKSQELALLFGKGNLTGQVTAYYNEYGLDNFTLALEPDGVTQYQLPIYEDTYLSRGIETWVKWRITRHFQWNGDVQWGDGKALHVNSWTGLGQNQTPVDTVVSGPIQRNPDWVLSNTFIYQYQDWAFNVRHRWMDKRKETNNPLDDRYLPAQNNTDLSIQYLGLKDTRISLDVRNVFNNLYISAYDTLIGGTYPTNVQKWDIYNQLPDSAIWIRHNDPRSFWLTVKHDF